MKKIIDKQIFRKYQIAQVQILEELKAYCEKNEIKYFLSAGTLLGAIREQGFIPWDPDIDVMMLRNDYDRFIHGFKIKQHKDYFLSIYSDAHHPSPHAVLYKYGTKIIFSNDILNKSIKHSRCIYIDILPLDDVPNDIKLRKKQISNLKKLEKLRYYKQGHISNYGPLYSKYILKKIVKYSLFFISMKKINTLYEKELMKYDGSHSGLVSDLTTKYDALKLTFPKSIFENSILVKFEESLFPAPKDYDYYLKILYGDYMKRPKDLESIKIPIEDYSAIIL